jgi:hypothetical protein
MGHTVFEGENCSQIHVDHGHIKGTTKRMTKRMTKGMIKGMTKRHGYTRLNPMVCFNFIKKKAFLGLFSFLFFMGL